MLDGVCIESILSGFNEIKVSIENYLCINIGLIRVELMVKVNLRYTYIEIVWECC